MSLAFIELHYLLSGTPVMFNAAAISRVYTTIGGDGETRVALLEDKNGQVNATECSRAAVHRVRETYDEVIAKLRTVGFVV